MSSPAPSPTPASDTEADARRSPDHDARSDADADARSPTEPRARSSSPASHPASGSAPADADEDEPLSSPDLLDLPIQLHSRSGSPQLPLVLTLPGTLIDPDTGAMDDAIERHFLHEAQELGVDVPPEPKSILKPAQQNDSTATVSSSPETQTLPSRASESTRPTSRSSSTNNAKPHPSKSSSKAPPVRKKAPAGVPPPPAIPRDRPASPSVHSSTSTDNGSSRFVKGLKRFSNYTKRRTMMLNKTIPMPSDTSVNSSGVSSEKDAAKLDSPASPPVDLVELDADQSELSAPSELPAQPVRHRKPIAGSLPSVMETSSYASSSPRSPTTNGLGGLNPDEAKEYDAEEAKSRSLRSRHLQAIRLHQLDEQSEFLEYYFGVIDKIRSRYMNDRNEAEQELKEHKEQIEGRHAEQHAELENRHLAKEMDLTRSLDQERQACETKLKHMDAYCNARPTDEDSDQPRRKVTEEDYRKLLQQYHVRQTMGGLHESKINVLREKQLKQMDRLNDSHQEEFDVLQERFDNEEEQRLAVQNSEEEKIRREFDLKKRRLIWRWKLMETVERRKLELESGDAFGELPEVQWGEEEWLQAAL